MLRLFEDKHGEEGLKNLKEILRGYPGSCEVELMLCLEDGSRVLMKSDSVRIELTQELRSRVNDLIGPENFRLLTNNGNGNGNGRRRNAAAHAG